MIRRSDSRNLLLILALCSCLPLASGCSPSADAPERAPAMTEQAPLIQKKRKSAVLVKTQDNIFVRLFSTIFGSAPPAPPAPEASAAPAPSDTPAAPSPSPSPSPADFIVPLWTAHEGWTNGQLITVFSWKAESAINEPATVSRYNSEIAAGAQPVSVVKLKPNDDLKLRERISNIIAKLPPKNAPKSRAECAHWFEIESFQGKRLFCEGPPDAQEGFDLLQTIKSLVP